jgi:hypothetical protein
LLGAIQQSQSNLWLRLLCDLFGHLCLLATLGIFDPGLGQKQTGADWPVERGEASRIIREILGADDHPGLCQFCGIRS